MRTRKVDTKVERQIVTAMIVNDKFLAEVRPLYQPDLMAVPFARTVAQWCLDYFGQYEVAPNLHIQDIFESHRRNGLPAEQADLIEDFLAALSDEHERGDKVNADYLLDEAEKYFDGRNQELLVEDIRALHARGEFAQADELIRTYKRVERPSSNFVEPLTDEDLIFEAFDDSDKDVLLELPGALGKLVGPIVREDFVGILGPEKRGKTWRLQNFAMRGLRAKLNVAYFDAGDMNKKQITVRLHTMNSGMASKKKYSGRQKFPVIDCAFNQDDSCVKRERTGRGSVIREMRKKGVLVLECVPLEEAPEHRPCSVCQRESPRDFRGAVWHEWREVELLTPARALELGKKTMSRSRKSLRVSCHPNSTLTVYGPGGMDATLRRWRDEDGFIPDLIIPDYADIFAPENLRIVEERPKQNETWKALRRLTQEWRAALVTATQADSDSYDRKTLREKNFSEDKRKYGHATKFLTLNQTPDEKRQGIIRIGTMFFREDDFDVEDTVTVLQHLGTGQPYLGSF